MKKLIFKSISAILSIAVLGSGAAQVMASEINGTKSILCDVGDNLTVGAYGESAAETQKLIDNRPDIQNRVEDMGRGLVAVKTDNGNFISWRWLGTESLETKYNLYRNGTLLNSKPMSLTNYTDIDGKAGDKYSVSAVVNDKEGEKCAEVPVWNGYYEIPLDKPSPEPALGEEQPQEFTAGDAAAADLDGDGEYEIVLKWNGMIRDASKGGNTSFCYIDAYELDGTRMWRINLGMNIRSGEHDTQFMCGDFDGDGSAEVAMRTADGTVAGDGTVIGDPKADWRDTNFKNLAGPLYLTVFNGEDGTILDTTEYWTQSTGTWDDGTKWDINSWGDDWGNRSERYLGAVGHFSKDGHLSFVQSRGYYDRTCIGAWHIDNGKIVTDFTFDSHYYPSDETHPPTSGQGYHNMVTADVDYDGYDEIVFGHLVIDNDGKPMYSTGLGHGDSQHVGDLVPSRPGLEVYTCQESRGSAYGFCMRDARTGEILYGMKTETDNGRACTADIDPRYEGEEAWSAYGVLTAANGEVLSTNYSMPTNYAIYWDGDLGREIEDGNAVYKYDLETSRVNPIFKAAGAHSINATKSNPCLQADLFGDWREELIFPENGDNKLRIYTTTIPTAYRIPTLTSDAEYYNAALWQNDCYNQPPHVGYYLGYDTKTVPVPQVYTLAKDGTKVTNPDLAKKNYSIDDLYFGDTVELVLDSPTALLNGAKVPVDEESEKTAPYLNDEDRTMVPIRFISEAFGAKVEWVDDTQEVKIQSDDAAIVMTVDKADYTINGDVKEMDTVPVIKNDRTFVPVRFIAEALGMNVEYYDGLIYISTTKDAPEDAAADKAKIEKTALAVPAFDFSTLEDYGNKELGLRYENIEIITSDGSDASAVDDFDTSTVWTCPAGGEIALNKGTWYGVPAAVIVFGDNKPHKFHIEYSGNGTDWQIGVADRVSDGVGGDYEKYYFGCPLYPNYIKYVSEDTEDTPIAEFLAPIVD